MSTPILTREQAVEFITTQMAHLDLGVKRALPKGGTWHYGVQDLRELLDAIYGGQPENDQQRLTKPGRFGSWELPK